VFLFSQFHLPRSAYLSETLSQLDSAITSDDVTAALGRSMSGRINQVAEWHKLRWLVQMASRGNVRNSTVDGVCGRMKLFTTMDRSLLVSNYQELFPCAAEPTFITSDQAVRKNNPQKLAAFLLTCKKSELCASQVANALEMAVKDVSRAFKSKSCEHLKCIGWELIAGNGKALKPSFRKTTITHRVGKFTWTT